MAIFFFFDEPKNFYDCHHFLSFGQFLLCCSAFRTCRASGRFIFNKWTILYTLISAILLMLGLGYSVYAKFTDPRQKSHINVLDNMMIAVIFLELSTSTCLFIFTIAAALWYAERHVALLECINEVDQRLISEFGANMNYHKLMRKNIVVTMVLAMLYSTSIFIAIPGIANGDLLLVFMGAMSYAVITSGPHLSDYVHINCAEILKIRFRLLQRLLDRDYLVRRFPDEAVRERRVHSAIDMVKALHMLIPEIRKIFMLCLLTTLAHDLTLTTTEMFTMFGRPFKTRLSSRTTFFVIMCIYAPFHKVFMAPFYCHLSIEEGAKCLDIIGQIDLWFPESKNTRELVASTMYWRMAQKFKYYCGLNIIFDKTIMTMVISVVVNYMMILIQFGMIEELQNLFESQTKVLHKWFGFMDDGSI